MTVEIAGDRPPRYGEVRVMRDARAGNPLGCAYGNLRGAPRYGDVRVPRAIASRPGGLSYNKITWVKKFLDKKARICDNVVIVSEKRSKTCIAQARG